MTSSPTSQSRLLHLVTIALAAVLCAAVAGCAETDAGDCGNRDECAADLVCRDQVCVAPAVDGSCTSHNECTRGQFCVSRLCTRTQPDMDDNSTVNADPNNADPNNADPNNADPNNADPNNADPNNADPNNNTGPDQIPPRVTSMTPAAGETGVALDAAIVLEFSEEVRDVGLEAKIELKYADSLDELVAVNITHDVDTITIQPVAPLDPSSPYIVDVTNEITDKAGNKLPDQVLWFFTTVGVIDEGHRALAAQFAPVVYQEVDPDLQRAPSDFFTRVDMDGNYDLQDNMQNYRASGLPAHAYYNVVETETHYLIQYLYYYPTAYLSTSTSFVLHDLTAVTVVTTRADPPQFVMAESAYGPQTTQYFGFALTGAGVSERGAGNLAHTFAPSDMWSDTHYRAYHGRHLHGSCHWGWEGTSLANWCVHNEGAFREPDASVVFYPSQTARGPADLTCGECDAEAGLSCVDGLCRDGDGNRALTYALLDFGDELWSRRVNVGNGDVVFSGTYNYAPHENSGQRPGGAKNFPASLAANEPGHRGATPFTWPSPGSVEDGQWWVDPAYSMNRHFDFGEGFSLDYCYNVYFGIDNRGEGACP